MADQISKRKGRTPLNRHHAERWRSIQTQIRRIERQGKRPVVELSERTLAATMACAEGSGSMATMAQFILDLPMRIVEPTRPMRIVAEAVPDES